MKANAGFPRQATPSYATRNGHVFTKDAGARVKCPEEKRRFENSNVIHEFL